MRGVDFTNFVSVILTKDDFNIIEIIIRMGKQIRMF